MDERQLIKKVYERWKASRAAMPVKHPDEETLACFLEGRLTEPEEAYIKEHILECDRCAEIVSAAAAEEDFSAPILGEERKSALKELYSGATLPEAEFSWKDGIFRLLRASGELSARRYALGGILRGVCQQGSGKAMLRSVRGSLRFEIAVSGCSGGYFFLRCGMHGKLPPGDIRAALYCRGREYESKVLPAGRAVFDCVPAGDYLLEISSPEGVRLAAVRLFLKG
ncbi:MAG: hypothetical protein PHE11_04085 [Candidatus Omnitrophica bacterium]|jgi:hypothetical protein|nr:hypothetical protein [Candidatus Omnitrophota bacterium]